MAVATRVKPPLSLRTARRWARDNLFGSVGNTLLTVVATLILGFALYQILRFVFVTADWEVITTNRKLLFIGRFPAGEPAGTPDETWRIWPPIFLVSALAGLSWGLWSRVERQTAIILAVGIALVFVLFAEGEVAIRTAVALALAGSGYVLAQAWLRGSRYLALARQLVVAGWLLPFPLAIFLLLAFGGVDPSLWGGFHLNIMLALVAIVASFPLGVLLALGRTSSFPVLRVASTAYIELIRGVPLITILLMAWLVLPRFLPSFAGLDDMELVYRVMVAFTLFTAAYVAEAVRGGLQAVPRGQVEAAKALGLATTRILALIVLPQALRAVIPALVGQFISLFKDTSLVFIIGLTDLLSSGRAVTDQRDFFAQQMEALLFVGVLFWIIAFSMSRMSQRLERTLGVGER